MPYLQTWTVIVLRRPILVSLDISWLFHPFHKFTWILLVLSFILKAIVLAILTRSAIETKLNILKNAVQFAIESLSKKFPPRCFFLTWIFSIMILQSAYQAKLFDSYRRSITSNKRLNIGELLAENYSIYTHYLYESIVIDQFDKLNKPSFLTLTIEKVLTDDTRLNIKTAAVASYVYFYIVYDHSELEKFIMERIYVEHVAMFFQKHSILTPELNKLIRRMDEAGLLLLWRVEYEHLSKINFTPQNNHMKPRKSLTFGNFKHVLYVFGFLHFASFSVFVLELIFNLYKTHKKNYKN